MGISQISGAASGMGMMGSEPQVAKINPDDLPDLDSLDFAPKPM